MRWLTQKEIKVAAKKSKRAAKKCSQEHWRQLSTATEDELKKGLKKKRVSTRNKHCALCIRYDCLICKGCPFADNSQLRDEWEDGRLNCPEIYWNVDRAFVLWRANKCPYSVFQQAAQKVYEALCEL